MYSEPVSSLLTGGESGLVTERYPYRGPTTKKAWAGFHGLMDSMICSIAVDKVMESLKAKDGNTLLSQLPRGSTSSMRGFEVVSIANH